MNNDKFKQKVKEWLKKEGLTVLGNWDIENNNDSVKIMVKLKINGTENCGSITTENREETIETAVLQLNEELIKRLEKAEPKV